jgi:hypothetical protein
MVTLILYLTNMVSDQERYLAYVIGLPADAARACPGASARSLDPAWPGR